MHIGFCAIFFAYANRGDIANFSVSGFSFFLTRASRVGISTRIHQNGRQLRRIRSINSHNSHLRSRFRISPSSIRSILCICFNGEYYVRLRHSKVIGLEYYYLIAAINIESKYFERSDYDKN